MKTFITLQTIKLDVDYTVKDYYYFNIYPNTSADITLNYNNNTDYKLVIFGDCNYFAISPGYAYVVTLTRCKTEYEMIVFGGNAIFDRLEKMQKEDNKTPFIINKNQILLEEFGESCIVLVNENEIVALSTST